MNVRKIVTLMIVLASISSFVFIYAYYEMTLKLADKSDCLAHWPEQLDPGYAFLWPNSELINLAQP